MKKTLSILLAIVMMFSVSLTAFAADVPAVELDKEYTVTLDNSKADYTFTAPEDGMYCVSAKLSLNKEDIALATVEVTNSEDISVASLWLAFFDNGEEGEDSFTLSHLDDDDCFAARKGAKLNLTVESDIPYFIEDETEEDVKLPPVTVTFKVTLMKDVREIKIGESYTVSESEYFIFKPTEDGVCDIYSYDSSYFSIMDADGEFYWSMDGDYGYPNEICFEYKAGGVYGVLLEPGCDDEYNDIDSVFHVVDAKTLKPEMIALDDITIVRGQEEYAFPAIYPMGANGNCGDLQVEVANEKIATAEYDSEMQTIIVHGKHLGKTTLTVTEPNSGVTKEVEIRVISRIEAFFRSVFEFIRDILFGFIFIR